MNTLQHEKKGKVVIGTIRTYNHDFLIDWLIQVRILPINFLGFEKEKQQNLFMERFVRAFDFRSRADLFSHAPAGIVAREIQFENITPTVGFETITKFLTGYGTNPDQLEVMVHAFGDDDTAPTDADTTLGNETSRKLLSSKAYDGASAFYTVFYDKAEGNGAHEEMGLFADADAGTPDDGTLWDRSLIDLTKTNTQSLTIDYQDTFVNNV